MLKNTYKSYPNEKGYFGQFGGRYVSETLMPLILEVEKEYEKIKNDKKLINELDYYLKTYVGRPSPLFFAESLSLSDKFMRIKLVIVWDKFCWQKKWVRLE